MTTPDDAAHPWELVAQLRAGTLAPALVGQVEAHLSGCPACAVEADAWDAAGAVIRRRFAAAAPPPLAGLLATRPAGSRPRPADPRRSVPGYAGRVAGHPWRRVLPLLTAQARLVPRSIWPVSAVVLAAAAVAAGTVPDAVGADLLGSTVPLVATVAVALASDDGTDPAAELASATITSRRAVLLARLTLVLGWVFALAAIASLLLARVAPPPLAPGPAAALVSTWLGPAAVLAAAGFALSVLWRATAGVGLAVTLWTVRTLAGAQVVRPAADVLTSAVWSAPTPLLLAAAALVVAATVLVPAGPRRLPTVA